MNWLKLAVPFSARIRALLTALLPLAAVAPTCPAMAAQPLTQAAITPGRPATFSLAVGDQPREFIVFAPSGWSPTRATPLVFILHGGGQSPGDLMKITGLNAQAAKSGFIAIWPVGVQLTWNAGGCCGPAALKQIDDVAFFRKLLLTLNQNISVNQNRIYATGISNGGMMAYRLACEMSDAFAAIAPVAATLETTSCNPGSPVSVLHYHGLADQNVPFKGGVGTDSKFPVPKRPVPDTMAIWQKINACPAATKLKEVGDTTYTGSACPKAEVVLATITGGGHAWPGGTPPSLDGAPSSAYVKATPEIASFFAAHPKAR